MSNCDRPTVRNPVERGHHVRHAALALGVEHAQRDEARSRRGALVLGGGRLQPVPPIMPATCEPWPKPSVNAMGTPAAPFTKSNWPDAREEVRMVGDAGVDDGDGDARAPAIRGVRAC
jgi:hypothetical protein